MLGAGETSWGLGAGVRGWEARVGLEGAGAGAGAGGQGIPVATRIVSSLSFRNSTSTSTRLTSALRLLHHLFLVPNSCDSVEST